MKKKKPYLRYLLFLLICIAFYFFFKNSLSEIWKEVCNTNASILFAISFAAILYHLMEGRITFLLAKRHTEDYTYLKGIKNSFYASFYRVVTLGSAGGLSAIYNLHVDNVPVSEGIGLYFAGYVIHKIAILLYGVIILIVRQAWIHQYFSEYRSYFIAAYIIGIAAVAALVLLCVSPFIYKILHFLLTKCKARFTNYTSKIEELDRKIIALQKEAKLLLTDKRLFFKLLILNFIKLSTYFIIPYLILSGSSSITPIDSLSLVAITYILAAAIPTPAGVGSIEAVYILLVVRFVSKVEAAASMLLFRFATMLVPCILGGCYIVIRNFLSVRREKSVSHQ